jgi:hypothetical protein
MYPIFNPTTLRCSQSHLSARLYSRSLPILSTPLTGRPHKTSSRPFTRNITISSSKHQSDLTLQSSAAKCTAQHVTEDPFVYHGPLTVAFRRLKLFSLASFGFSSMLSPFMFLVESSIPMNARFALAGIAVGTSGLSTGLVSWCAKPYVTKMRRFRPDNVGSAEELELTTSTLLLRQRFTKVYPFSLLGNL